MWLIPYSLALAGPALTDSRLLAVLVTGLAAPPLVAIGAFRQGAWRLASIFGLTAHFLAIRYASWSASGGALAAINAGPPFHLERISHETSAYWSISAFCLLVSTLSLATGALVCLGRWVSPRVHEHPQPAPPWVTHLPAISALVPGIVGTLSLPFTRDLNGVGLIVCEPLLLLVAVALWRSRTRWHPSEAALLVAVTVGYLQVWDMSVIYEPVYANKARSLLTDDYKAILRHGSNMDVRWLRAMIMLSAPAMCVALAARADSSRRAVLLVFPVAAAFLAVDSRRPSGVYQAQLATKILIATGHFQREYPQAEVEVERVESE